MKPCITCEAEKPLAEFYTHPQMSDGHLNKCKTCVKSYINGRRKDPIAGAKIRAYDRSRGNRQPRDYGRRYIAQNPEKCAARHARYKAQNPEKNAAHNAVNNAVRDGRLFKPSACDMCGAEGVRIHGHHHDYSRPLDVLWVCNPCHGQAHRDINERKRIAP